VETSTHLALVPTAAAATFHLATLTAFAIGLRRRRRTPAALARAPSVSILKPLAGTDDELDANLESFARIDYPAFEIVLGVASTDDPAYGVARRFVARHPAIAARVVVTNPAAAVNPKVAQLVELDRAARGEVVVISDSNVRVGRAYLDSLVRELERPGVGIVTSLFAGTGEQTLGAALENLQLGAVVAPSIVAASVLTRRALTVGKSMAMWRRDLALIGGFASIGDVLAEDHVLGRRFLDAGFAVATALEPVENRNIACSFARTLERHTRWSKIRRSLCPTAFAAEPLISPLVVATGTALAAPSRLHVAVLAAVAVVQTLLAMATLRALRGAALRWYWAPLEIARTYVLFGCWIGACASRTIAWRGHRFELGRGSRIVRLFDASPAGTEAPDGAG